MTMNWKCREFKIMKFDNIEDYQNNKVSSIETHHGNIITDNGLVAMWLLAMGKGGSATTVGSTQMTVYPFTTTDSKIAIGSGSTAAVGSDTQLANKLDEIEITSIDILSDPSSNKCTIKFQAEAGTGIATGNWNEWGIYDKTDGTLFNRKVESMGTKTATSLWRIEVAIDLIRS